MVCEARISNLARGYTEASISSSVWSSSALVPLSNWILLPRSFGCTYAIAPSDDQWRSDLLSFCACSSWASLQT